MTSAQEKRLGVLAVKSGRQIVDICEMWNERAAIREYDGGKSRREAEVLAFDDVAMEVLR